MPVATEKKNDCMELEYVQDIANKFDPNQMPLDDLDNMGVAERAVEQHNQPIPEEHQQQQQEVNAVAPQQVVLKEGIRTAVIFDWDDTILPSTFLASKGYRLDNNMVRLPEVDEQLCQMETSAIALLSVAIQYGDVTIITNAETGWVQLSCSKFMPKLYPLLEKVTILSARSTFEAEHPECPLKWKQCAFERTLGHVFLGYDGPKNVLSFGDSHVEREACRTVTKTMENTKTKSVKFCERPSIEQLRRQVDLIANCFQIIYSREEDLDLMLTISFMY